MEAKNKKKLVLFDFDGVLVNTRELGYEVQKKYDPEITKEFFASLDHGNFLENYEKAVGEGKITHVSDWDTHYLEFLQKISTHDVIGQLVRSLGAEYVLIIVSSALSSHIADFLKKENLTECFVEILGSDMHRSKEVKINSILERYHTNHDDVIFVTDTLGDIRAGNECNIKTVAVTWGSNDKETLAMGTPYAIVDDVLQLEVSIREFFRVQKM